MGLKFDALCQRAVELAKRAAAQQQSLDAGLLLAALYYVGEFETKYPDLKQFLAAPAPVENAGAPEKVTLAADLRPIFTGLATRENPITAEELFRLLLQSEAGRQALLAKGMPAELLQKALQTSPDESPGWRSSEARTKALKELSPYGRMLTAAALPPGNLTEGEESLNCLVRILCNIKRRNAVLVGFPGTGKTAIVYELARRLYRGDASLPSMLRDLDIFELNPAALRAGASMVGEYDARVSNLLRVLAAHPKIILFADEIHSLLQSSVHERGPFSDANESFKAAMGKGELTFIGCTTPAEHRRFLEPDKALERRFAVVHVAAPSLATTAAILQSRRPGLEKHYAPLTIPKPLIEKVVEYAEQYLPTRHQPDKSIRLLESACAFCVTARPPLPEVTEAALWQAMEDLVGYHLAHRARLTKDQVLARLRSRIFGQDKALEGIAQAFVAGLGGWSGRPGPRGVYLFAGPTGVGKTETALLLAQILGGDRPSLVRIDCNTLQSSAIDSGVAKNRLLGVPPGYVGYARGQGGILSRVRDFPESIVLFDEFEKASSSIGQILLQILDKGQVEDVDGNLLDFRRAYVIFTTNAGSVYQGRQLGFKTEEEVPQTDLDQMKACLANLGLAEEFLGRLTHTFLFTGLTAAVIQQVLQQQLEDMRKTSQAKGVELSWSEELVPHLLAAWQISLGVRFAITVLQNRITEQLNVAEAQGDLQGVTRIRLEVMPSDKRQAGPDLVGLARCRKENNMLVISLA